MSCVLIPQDKGPGDYCDALTISFALTFSLLTDANRGRIRQLFLRSSVSSLSSTAAAKNRMGFFHRGSSDSGGLKGI